MNQFEQIREAAAEICDDQHDKARTSPGAARADACAKAIRAMPLPEVATDIEALRKENEQLREALIDLISIAKIHQDATKNRFAWAEIDCAEEALKGGAE